jgi:hypothetical protein
MTWNGTGFKISKTVLKLWKTDYDVDISRAWEGIRENKKYPATESLTFLWDDIAYAMAW